MMELLRGSDGAIYIKACDRFGGNSLIRRDKIEVVTRGSSDDECYFTMLDGTTIGVSEKIDTAVEFVLREFKEKLPPEPETPNEADMRIIDSDFSIRTRNVLLRYFDEKRNLMPTIRDITSLTRSECAKQRNMGRKSLEEIDMKLAEYGLSFKKEVDG